MKIATLNRIAGRIATALALVFPPIPIISSYGPGRYPWGICGRVRL